MPPPTPMTNTPPQPAPVDLPRAFRAVASSAWVVTTAHEGRPVGFTAVSVVSVSLAPPLVSFNVSRTSSSLAAVLASGRVAVHLLGEDQEVLARRFSAPAPGRFPADGSWAWDDDGLPRLGGAVVRLSGPVVSSFDAGDSVLFLAGVERSEVGETAPLIHHGRGYHRLPASRAVA